MQLVRKATCISTVSTLTSDRKELTTRTTISSTLARYTVGLVHYLCQEGYVLPNVCLSVHWQLHLNAIDWILRQFYERCIFDFIKDVHFYHPLYYLLPTFYGSYKALFIIHSFYWFYYYPSFFIFSFAPCYSIFIVAK